MKVINIFGAPSAGKSTLAANIFSYLKKESDVKVEYVNEFAKSLAYDKNLKAIKCQPYVFGNQLYYVDRLKDEVDYVISDSPVLLSAIYGKSYPASFIQSCIDIHNRYDNINIVLRSNFNKYQSYGRLHNEKECKNLQKNIFDILNQNQINYLSLESYSDNLLEKSLQYIGVNFEKRA